jgi:Ca2+-binding RTX toxin-like protein
MRRLTRRPWRRRVLAVGALAVFLTVVSSASAAVTASFNSGTLSVASDVGDTITISCVGGNVKVNTNDPETDPPGGTVQCSVVEYINVQGGTGADDIDLSGVTPASFLALTEIFVFGDSGDDEITGGSFSEDLSGGSGADSISGAEGNDFVDGDEDNDVSLNGGAGRDVLYGSDGNDVLHGDAGADFLYGALGVDEAHGDLDDDYVEGDIFDLALSGGDGTDSLELFGSVNSETIDAAVGSTGFETAEIYGLGGNDTLLGLAGSDYLNGGEGADLVDGRAGDDFLYGGPGPFDDTLSGGDGNDELSGQGSDTLRAGSGSDYLYMYESSPTADGEDGPDIYDVEFGALGLVTIADSGTTGTDELYVWPCDGTQVSGSQAIRGAEVINYSGIEVAPCAYSVAPPPPPEPPPPAPTPPAATPPAPPSPRPAAPRAAPKVVKKVTICHNSRTKKVTKKQLQALRKKAAKAKKKGAKVKITMGACKKPKKKR